MHSTTKLCPKLGAEKQNLEASWIQNCHLRHESLKLYIANDFKWGWGLYFPCEEMTTFPYTIILLEKMKFMLGNMKLQYYPLW